MADVEAAAPVRAAAPPKKRRTLFLLFGCLSVSWLAAIVYMMHDLREEVRYEESMDFAGADIDSVYGLETAAACRTACEEHPRCLAFTYVKTDKACWLKGEGYSAKSNPNTISGGLNASLSASKRAALNGSLMDAEEESERDWARDDDEFDNQRQPSEEEGEEYSADEEQFRSDDENEEVVSRVTLSEEEALQYNDSTSFFGDLKLLHDVRAPSDCEDYCVANGRCIAWTLDKER
jgi:hypothetical protein